jgi:hypothetical protein
VEEITRILFGSWHLFYPLLITSGIIFVYAFTTRSWIWMIISGIVLYPDAWYFSKYPAFSWVEFIPVVQVIFAVVFFLMKRRSKSHF